MDYFLEEELGETKMELVFRKIDENNEKDLLELNELMEHLIEKVHQMERLKEIIATYNQREDAYVMVAEDASCGRICGSLLAIVFDDYCGDCKPLMLIENVVVHKDYQHRGIATAMFEHVEEWGKKFGVNYALLCSDMEREGAHEFYRSIGLKEVKGFKKYM